jgi:hypothetical protein
MSFEINSTFLAEGLYWTRLVCRTICGHVQVLKCGRSKLAEEGCDGLS